VRTRGATSAPGFRLALAAGVIVASALAAAPRAGAAAVGPIVVLPASGRGVSAPIVRYVRQWLVMDLWGALGARVIDYDRPPVAIQLDPRTLAWVAAYAGGQVAVALDGSREAGVTTLDVTCYDVAAAAPVGHARVSTVAGPEVLRELTQAVATRALQILDGRFADPPRAPPSPPSFRFGGRALVMVPVVTLGGGAQGLGGFGFTATINLPGSFADLLADGGAGGGRYTVGVGTGFHALLSDGARAPFVGGSVHWVTQHFGGRSAAGVQLRPTVGFAWGRDEIVQGRVDLSYFIDLFEERSLDRLIAGSDVNIRAHGPMVALGAAF
jgi:hypothetical protein